MASRDLRSTASGPLPAANPDAALPAGMSLLQLIAAGWEVIESDGWQMTIQAPEHWDEDGPCELVVDTQAPQYRCTRCGRDEIDARANGCERGPCPMEFVG